MEVIVKYTGTSYYTGKLIYPKVIHDIDYIGNDLIEIDERIVKIDKTNLLWENDLASIADWEIVAIDGVYINGHGKSDIENMVKILFNHNAQKQTILDFIACYHKMEDSIKSEDLSLLQKIDVVLNSLDIAYSSSINTLKELKDERLYIESLDLDKMIEYKSNRLKE